MNVPPVPAADGLSAEGGTGAGWRTMGAAAGTVGAVLAGTGLGASVVSVASASGAGVGAGTRRAGLGAGAGVALMADSSRGDPAAGFAVFAAAGRVGSVF